MIEGIGIENFKSVEKLKFKLARLNVFIGANGAGKSNIFEAITFGAAASANKLDNEFLVSRGIRVTEPELMRSAFESLIVIDNIILNFTIDGKDLKLELFLSNDINKTWHCNLGFLSEPLMEKILRLSDGKLLVNAAEFKELFFGSLPEFIKDFLTYTPEERALRNFYEEGQIQPLGRNGEGLFKLLKNMDKAELAEIKENLQLIDWFEDFEIPDGLLSMERSLNIKDRYIAEDIEFFDLKSTNEGFLFLLFYLALVISKKTPKFFAIDNIDNALNPKLCVQIIQTISRLAEKHDKQILVSTHNPAILDGLNLESENEKLFVVYRNVKGRTKLDKIDATNFNTKGKVRLSEAFIRGYIGGLNEHSL